MRGTLRDLTLNRDGTQNITLTVEADFREQFDAMRGKGLDIDIRPHREKRSLDANAYCWVLIDKLASVLHLDKSEVYREAIREIGGVSDVVCVREVGVETLCAAWRARGMGWQAEIMGKSKIPGCANVALYYGSSTYDTRQMSALIEHLIAEAEAQGIETITPARKAELIRRWGQ